MVGLRGFNRGDKGAEGEKGGKLVKIAAKVERGGGWESGGLRT